MTEPAADPVPVLVTHGGAVATVTLNRPKRRNALNEAMSLRLVEALGEISTHEDIKVVVLTGADGSFCAGADLVDIEPSRLASEMVIHNQIVTTLRAMPQPIIAKVHGAAVGAGCNIALTCDFVLCDETARFAQIFPRIGLSVDLGGSWILTRLVGLRKARELALLGDDVDGPGAARIGLVHDCTPADELDAAVEALAGRLAALSRAAQARTKHLLDDALSGTHAEALQREIDAQVANVENPEFHEALARFHTRHSGGKP